METKTMLYYLSLLLIVGSIAEIYTRAKGLGAAVQKDRKGKVIPYQSKLVGPILLGIISIVLAIATSQ
jgi:hypothetical protein